MHSSMGLCHDCCRCLAWRGSNFPCPSHRRWWPKKGLKIERKPFSTRFASLLRHLYEYQKEIIQRSKQVYKACVRLGWQVFCLSVSLPLSHQNRCKKRRVCASKVGRKATSNYCSFADSFQITFVPQQRLPFAMHHRWLVLVRGRTTWQPVVDWLPWGKCRVNDGLHSFPLPWPWQRIQ